MFILLLSLAAASSPWIDQALTLVGQGDTQGAWDAALPHLFFPPAPHGRAPDIDRTSPSAFSGYASVHIVCGVTVGGGEAPIHIWLGTPGEGGELVLATPEIVEGGSTEGLVRGISLGNGNLLLGEVTSQRREERRAQARTALWIRSYYPADPSDTGCSDTAAATMASQNSAFYNTASQQEITSLAITIAPPVALDHDKGWYVGTYGTGGYGTMCTEIKNKAKANNAAHDCSLFNHCMCEWPQYEFSGWAGMANVYGSNIWIQYSKLDVIAHEFGHNFGLHHANRWYTDSTPSQGLIYGPYTETSYSWEYRDYWDMMGLSHGSTPMETRVFHPRHRIINIYQGDRWVKDDQVQLISDGVGKIYAHDSAQSSGKVIALKIPRDDSTSFWVTFRGGLGSTSTASHSVFLHACDENYSPNRTLLLSGDPRESNINIRDPFGVGRSWYEHGIVISALSTSPSDTLGYAKVQVCNISTVFPNSPPVIKSFKANKHVYKSDETVTFTTKATDDENLQYYYRWGSAYYSGEVMYSTNDATVSHDYRILSGDLYYTAVVIVSDGYGGVASAATTIKTISSSHSTTACDDSHSSHCKVCNGVSGDCEWCADGYYANGKDCLACTGSCLVCRSTTECLLCKDRYRPAAGGGCESCKDATGEKHCAACHYPSRTDSGGAPNFMTGSDAICLACDSGYVLEYGKCIHPPCGDCCDYSCLDCAGIRDGDNEYDECGICGGKGGICLNDVTQALGPVIGITLGVGALAAGLMGVLGYCSRRKQ